MSRMLGTNDSSATSPYLALLAGCSTVRSHRPISSWRGISNKMSALLSSRTPDGHLVQLDGGHAYAYGDGLAVFAAGAYAFIQLQIVADHRHVFQGFGAVADQGGVADGGGDFAVFDEVGFRG